MKSFSSSTTSTLSYRHSFLFVVLALSRTAQAGFLILNYDPAPEPGTETSPPGAESIIWDPAYLPATIGGLVGAYALSLVLVAAILLVLAKRRRDHIDGVDAPQPDLGEADLPHFTFPTIDGKQAVSNFPYPVTPGHPQQQQPQHPWVDPVSPNSEVSACNPGVDIHVDQRVVRHDREMAQQQLEDMYALVMEQEEAKARGISLPLNAPAPVPTPPTPKSARKAKPAGLDLAKGEKKESRTTSFLNALRSPLKKDRQVHRAINISSPLMTPQSAGFPRHVDMSMAQEMNTIPPRLYAAPLSPPPVPGNNNGFKLDLAQPPPRKGSHSTQGAQSHHTHHTTHGQGQEPTPDASPESTLSIDERLRGQLPDATSSAHARQPSDPTPPSATSERSSSPLVGLPSSPKPSVTRFPSLPQSPKPGSTFSSSAVRQGGSLPLRAYEPSPLASPSQSSFQTTTKQTVFERVGPMSPGGGMKTPFTGAAVPYSPYQPQTPCIPITPSLVTRKDRKRMKKLEPKTPTLEMVKGDDEVW